MPLGSFRLNTLSAGLAELAPTILYRFDPYAQYLKLSVPFDSQNQTEDIAYKVLNSGLTAAATKTQGASSSNSTEQVKWTTTPNYVNALKNTRAGSALTYSIPGGIPTSDSGTYVVEGWFYATDSATNSNWALSSADSGGRWLLGLNTGSTSQFAGENWVGIGSGWHHIAIVCDVGTKRFYVDGVYKGAFSTSNTGFSTLHVGQFNAGDSNDFLGYIQDLRVYVGTNKGYTGTNTGSANFTLPSSIIELTNSTVANSSITPLGVTSNNNLHVMGQNRYMGTDSSGRPVYGIAYLDTAGTTGYIVMYRINSDLTVTAGSPYTVASCVNIQMVTEQDGTNAFTTTNQAAYGYVSWKMASGYGRGRVAAFAYNRDTLAVTSVGSYVETTRDTYNFFPIGYIGTRRIAAGGNGGNNGVFMEFEIFSRTDGSTTLTRNHAVGSIGPAGQGTGSTVLGFGSDRFVHAWYNGNNGHSVPISISKYNGTATLNNLDWTLARLQSATVTEFSTGNFAIPLNATDKFLSAGWSNAPNGYDGYFGFQANTINWQSAGVAPTISSEGSVLAQTNHLVARTSMIQGETADVFYQVFFDYWDNRRWKFRRYTVSGTTITPDPVWTPITQIDNTGIDYNWFAANSRAVSISGVTYIPTVVRKTSDGSLSVLVTKNLQASGAVQRTAKTITFTGNTLLKSDAYKFSYYASYFDGSGDFLKTPQFTMNPKKTIECFFRANANTGEQTIFRIHNSSDSFVCNIGILNGQVYMYAGGTAAGGTVAANTWHHLAFVDDGSNMYLFLDGVSVTSRGSIGQVTNGYLYIGGGGGSVGIAGYVDEVRVSNFNRYTANFTAPATAFLPDAATDLLLHMGPVNNSMTTTRDDNGNIQYTGT